MEYAPPGKITMAAPVGFVPSTRYGVMVGISLLDVPVAPGAPLGHKGIALCISARHKMSEADKKANVKKVFMVKVGKNIRKKMSEGEKNCASRRWFFVKIEF
jgi:hypothetical protein